MSLTKHIEILCHQVTEEKDGDNCLSLVRQLNQELLRSSESPEHAAVTGYTSLRRTRLAQRELLPTILPSRNATSETGRPSKGQ